MRVHQLIAVRYLFGRKSVVNTISIVSLVGLMVSAAALIVVLSVYNGIGNITRSLFNTFDPELLIEPAQGKTLRLPPSLPELLGDEVACACPLVEESAWVTYGANQAIVTLRGVDNPDTYAQITHIDTLVAEGQYQLRTADGQPRLLLGGELYYRLGVSPHGNMAVAVHIPKRGTHTMGYSMDEAFNIGHALPAGNFFIQQDIDARYVLTDIAFVRNLMHYAPDECTSVALQLQPGANPAKVKRRLNSTLDNMVVKDRYDQQPLYFKIFRTERLGIYLILSLIVLISTLSLVASLSLLVISKRSDIFILRSMGMTTTQLRRAFLDEGLLICGIATTAGLILGFIICFVQQQFGLIKMGDGNFVVQAFPVAMRARDFLYTFLLVMALSSAAVWLTVRRAARPTA